MIDFKKGLKVTAPIVTSASSDKYPTHIDELGLGGYRVVSLIADLNKIPSQRSKIGMLAYVLETNEIYILTNTGWNKWLSYDNLDLSLEDIKLDIIDLRYDTQHLSSNIINNYLSRSLQKGYILLGNDFNLAEQQKTIGIDNLPLLGPARFPLPNASQLSQLGLDIIPGAITALNNFINEHAYLPNPTQPLDITDPSKNLNIKDIFTLIMGGAWLPETFIGNGSIINPLSRETISSATLAFTKVATARLFKIFENSSFIVSNKNTRFVWENSLAELLANTPGLSIIAKLYGYSNTFDFGGNAQALDDIDAGLLKQNKKADSEKGDGKLVKAIAGQDYVDVTNDTENFKIALIKPLPAPEPGVVANDDKKFIARSTIELKDIAPAEATYILQKPHNKLEHAQALSTLGSGILKIASLAVGEVASGKIAIASGGKVPEVNDYVRPEDLLQEIEVVEGEITAIEGEIATLQTEIGALIEALSTLTGVTIGWNTVNSILSFLGMGTAVSALSTKKDLEQLKTDYANTFKTKTLESDDLKINNLTTTKNLTVSNNFTTNNLTATNSTHSSLKVTDNLTIPIYKQAQIPMNQQIGSIFLKIRN